MHNRQRQAERNEWVAYAVARAAGRKLYYDTGLAASQKVVQSGSTKQSHSPRNGRGMNAVVNIFGERIENEFEDPDLPLGSGVSGLLGNLTLWEVQRGTVQARIKNLWLPLSLSAHHWGASDVQMFRRSGSGCQGPEEDVASAVLRKHFHSSHYTKR